MIWHSGSKLGPFEQLQDFGSSKQAIMLLKCPDQDILLVWIRTFLCPDHICLTLTISNGIPPSTSIPPFKRNPQGEYSPSRWISTDWIYSFWFEYILKITHNTKITLNWHYIILFFYFSSHIEHSFCQYMFKPRYRCLYVSLLQLGLLNI